MEHVLPLNGRPLSNRAVGARPAGGEPRCRSFCCILWRSLTKEKDTDIIKFTTPAGVEIETLMGKEQAMSFQSYEFLFVFLPVTFAGWWLLNWRGYGKLAQIFLLGASLFFYGLGGLAFLPLLAGSILFNFFVGKGLGAAAGWRKVLLVLGLLGNLGVLGYFKYMNFFLENLNLLLGTSIGALSLLLPLGISFFTFQQIAYLVDRYRGDKVSYTLLEYACFVSFFPCVASGPIAFHDEVIPQLRRAAGKGPTAQGVAEGLWLFSLGIWKKVILAEAFGGGADWGFGNLTDLNTTTALAVVLSYTLQLYFDFSGYTNMARGVGKMLGITLPENFDVPYQALTIRGFWKGWHMTMTRFFTRYLYIPLGGSRRGMGRTCVNTLVIFLASGLWHGADWSFVVWGGLHGLAMVADRLLGRGVDRLHPVLSWAITFGYVNFCWIFFRAGTIGEGLTLCQRIAQCDLGSLANSFTNKFQLPEITWLARQAGVDPAQLALPVSLAFLAGGMVLCLQERPVARRSDGMTARRGVLAGLLLFWSVISLTGVSQFIYSNF